MIFAPDTDKRLLISTVADTRGTQLQVILKRVDPRRYVLSIEPVTRTVTVGPASGLDVREITAERAVWTGCPVPSEPMDCLVQLRAHGEVHPCRAWRDGDMLQISLREPARGVASGQAAVLYRGDTVLSSATIRATAALAGSAA